MSRLRILLELFVVVATAWIVSFQLALGLRIPTGWLPALLIATLVVAVLPWIRGWNRSWETFGTTDRRLLRGLAGVACLLSAVVLVSSRPDADDLGYLRGPLIDSADPGEAITVDRFRWDDRPWPMVRFLNENEAFEPFVVMVSRIFGLDPVAAYHNLFAIPSVFLWCVVLAAMLEFFRVPRRWIPWAVLASAGLLFLDGGTHRSFGNMSLIRIWQGKVVAWSVVLPLLVLLQLRFLSRPQVRRFSLVVMAAVVGVALNRSMVVMVVVAGTAVPLAYAIAYGFQRRRLERVALGLLAPAPAWLIGSAVLIFVSQETPSELRTLLSSGFSDVRGAQIVLERIAGGEWSMLFRDALLLGLLPFVALSRPRGRLIAVLAGVVVGLCFVPPIGGLTSMALGSNVWRLYYLLPIPLCFALVFEALRRGCSRSRQRVWPSWLVVGLIAVVWLPHFSPVLTEKNSVEWKTPMAYRFPAKVREFVQTAEEELKNRRVLAPESVAVALGLTHFDSVGLVSTRIMYAVGDRRRQVSRANRVLSDCVIYPAVVASFRELVAEGVEVVVFGECSDQSIAELNQHLDRQLVPKLAAGGYRLFALEPAAEPPIHPISE